MTKPKAILPNNSNQITLVCDTHHIEIKNWDYTDEGMTIHLSVKNKRVEKTDD